MRHQPCSVHAVASESARQLVVHATGSHGCQGAFHHLQAAWVPGAGVVAQQEFMDHWLRELRRPAESPVPRVEGAREGLNRPPRDIFVHCRNRRRRGPQRGADLRRGGHHPVTPVPPGVGHGLEDLAETRHPRPRFGWVVRAGVERSAFMIQKDGHRPATVAGHRCCGGHVGGIDIRPLLSIDLDADEAVVHERRNSWVFERLVRHDVAPVTGRISDGQQDGDIATDGLLEGGVPPLVPVDRVVRMLLQVRREGMCESVGHGTMVVRDRGPRQSRWALRPPALDGAQAERWGSAPAEPHPTRGPPLTHALGCGVQRR